MIEMFLIILIIIGNFEGRRIRSTLIFLRKLSLKCHLDTRPLRMIKVGIEKPFIIGDFAQV